MEFLRPLREGQSLNQVEQWKLSRHPLEIIAAICERYAFEGAESTIRQNQRIAAVVLPQIDAWIASEAR